MVQPFPCFNTQPPEGGWVPISASDVSADAVSTHSRLKAAGLIIILDKSCKMVSTHSRLKAAGSDGLCDV